MRISALIRRIIRQFIHDKRSMALLIAAPLLVLSLMYLVFNGDTVKPSIGTVQVPEAMKEHLMENEADVTAVGTMEEAEEKLAQGQLDAMIWQEEGLLHIKLEGSDPNRNRAVLGVFQAMRQEQLAAQLQNTSTSPVIEYLHGSAAMSTFDHFSPVLIGLFAFFFVFLIAGVSFLKERTSGTLERLLATPLRRWEIVVGYMAGFGIFTGLQAVLIAGYTVGVLGSLIEGSFWLVLLIMLLLSFTALSFGTFLSAFANTEFQMIQFIPIVIVPQVFFSGIFDLESISPWLRWLTHITPLKYGADALRGVMIRGEGLSSIALELSVLLLLTLFFMTANVFALRKHRKI
ncbi:ABC transporter permease [Marinicrinis lubricantis]|uniref:ABC transporter permease n=1 Tax=Marinicrinis lubricantis TaxID=2086470 RepID=A0ABW1IVK7_9BACL